MDEKKLLSDEFQVVVADAANGNQFDSDFQRARKAYAFHVQLMQDDPSYKNTFEAYRRLGETKVFEELNKKIQAVEYGDGNYFKDVLKATWAMVSHFPTVVKMHSYERQLLNYAKPLIERAVQ